MSALVIDTSSWIDYLGFGKHDAIIEPGLEEGRVYLPPIVAAELMSGRMSERERALLEGLLETLPLCTAELAHWVRVGRLRSALGAKGLSISTPDAHVAQCALDLDADLLSQDAVFQHVARHTRLRTQC